MLEEGLDGGFVEIGVVVCDEDGFILEGGDRG